MNNGVSLDLHTVLIIFGALLLAIVVLGIFLVRFHLQIKILRDRVVSAERESMIASRSSLGLGQRIMVLEQKLNEQHNLLNTKAEVSRTERSHPDEEFQSYSEANHLFELGLPLEEVIKRCGLSRAEASLLEAIWKNDSNNHSQ